MIDFLMISTRSIKRGAGTEVYPKFIIKKSSDLMIRGGDFYAIWLEDRGLWSTDEQDALALIDSELDKYAEEHQATLEGEVKIAHMWDAETRMIEKWHNYCKRDMRDSYHMLDEKLIFSNTETNKKDYASKRLNYPLEKGDLTAYNKLMSTLYSEDERAKIEWAIGSIVSGDSKKIQKFLVLYGAAGTGKSTVLNIIQKLFAGYYSVFDAKALGSTSNSFALEAFKTNPLVAIQHDGDLSRIEDNTRLNSLVSHEKMTVNEKFKSTYSSSFKAFLFMGTNKPVKITDAKSGIIRRLIDVSPTGDKIPAKEYKTIMKQIDFELGAIASHCKEVYEEYPGRYDNYIPITMLGASNDFYNFVLDSYLIFKRDDGVTLKAAWEMYKTYCEDANVSYPLSRRIFKEELKNYFKDFQERFDLADGTRARSYYSGFRTEKFEDKKPRREKSKKTNLIELKEQHSVFDDICKDCLAQYSSEDGKPTKKWDKVKAKLSDLDTSKEHYVMVPENHIVIDFDIPDETGAKSPERNLEEASKWPPTYAELSRGGAGIHLHYIYTGDVSKLSRVYDDHIEVKIATGKSSLRRKLTKCNNLPIATINSGLPLKGEKKVVKFDTIKSEKGLRTLIKRNLNKEIHPGTKPSIDFIYKILEDAYASDLKYDISDMRNAVFAFAVNSTHQADYCIKLVNQMHFKSEERNDSIDEADKPLVFYDIEVFPNLFLVNWKIQGEGKPVVRMINPTSKEIEDLLQYRLVGFNCRRYDNHIIYARLMGYSNEQLYKLSQNIVNAKKGNRNCFFGEAYNLSYTDVYDFASAGNKKSLKKLEIEMGIHHQELGLPWDQPVDESLWTKVAEYCDNDVIATEAAFNYLKADWTARQILADLAGGSVNDTTNSLTQRIIFGGNRNPQGVFNYRNLAEPVTDISRSMQEFLDEACPEMMSHTHGDAQSVLPYFDGYLYDHGKSTYMGENVGEGGYVYAEPGMYTDVALLDISSMHPHSVIAEVLFGEEFTRKFREIVEGRVSIKHEDWDAVSRMLNGKLTPYIQRVKDGEMTSKDLANALKTAINSVYGLTSASFDNPFRDKRNIDNIVAKRGALFMIQLKYAVQEKGYQVAHIKTDSIKIPNATPKIIEFVMDMGERYGYSFEHEATYNRMCLVNDAVYIAKYETAERCESMYGYSPGDNKKKGGKWTATGTQFQIPYVFKKLFSREEITLDDMCETKSVSSALYLDMNENLPDVSDLEKEYAKYEKDFKEGVLSDMHFETLCQELNPKIAEGHDYIFVGRVGQFCPVKPGAGGGLLRREKDGKYYAATGTTGYRWLESEMVRELHKEDDIDKSYYNRLVDEAVETISKYGDFEMFTSDQPYIWEFGSNDADYDVEVPPWMPPCGDKKYESCYDCPHLKETDDGVRCDSNYDISNILLKGNMNDPESTEKEN